MSGKVGCGMSADNADEKVWQDPRNLFTKISPRASEPPPTFDKRTCSVPWERSRMAQKFFHGESEGNG